jgi:hypothetical protein
MTGLGRRTATTSSVYGSTVMTNSARWIVWQTASSRNRWNDVGCGAREQSPHSFHPQSQCLAIPCSD